MTPRLRALLLVPGYNTTEMGAVGMLRRLNLLHLRHTLTPNKRQAITPQSISSVVAVPVLVAVVVVVVVAVVVVYETATATPSSRFSGSSCRSSSRSRREWG